MIGVAAVRDREDKEEREEERGKGKGKEEEEKSKERRNRNEARFDDEVQEALRHIDDPIALSRLPLARLAAVEKYSAHKFPGRTAWRGLGLQDLVRTAGYELVADMGGPDSNRLAKFIHLYLQGMPLQDIADRLGVRREHASRVYRREAARLIATGVRDLVASRP
jgi:hypothetical protein